MTETYAIACAVHARVGDVVHVLMLGAEKPRGLAAAMRSVLTTSQERSPLLYNESAGAWFMTTDHVVRAAPRGPGQALHHTAAPDPSLPVERVVRGRVVATATAQDMTNHHLDTLVTVDVVDDRILAPGEPWISAEGGPLDR